MLRLLKWFLGCAALPLMLCPAVGLAQENVEFDLKIHRLEDFENVTANVTFLYLAGSGQWIEENITLATRNSDKQFLLKKKIPIAGRDYQGGILFGAIRDETRIVKQIPLRIVELSDLSDRGLYQVRLIPTQLKGETAFRESHPITNEKSGFRSLNDGNVTFVLRVYRTLIEQDYVEDKSAWTSIEQFFNNNLGYLNDGGKEKISQIVSFLAAQYEKDLVREDREDFFVKAYVGFLGGIVKGGFGTRPAPDADNLEEHAIKQISKIVGNDAQLVLPEVVIGVGHFKDAKRYSACLEVTQNAINSYAGKPEYLAGAKENEVRRELLKNLMKKAVDCAQRYYVENSIDENASAGALKGGVTFLAQDPQFSGFLNDYRSFFETLEETGGILSSSERNKLGKKQIYQYYDLIGEAGIS